MKESELIQLLQKGDPEGLEYFIRLYKPLMRYIIAPILKDLREQEECLSDVSMRVWEKIDTYDPERGSWTTWLTAITRNTALNRFRLQAAQGHEVKLSDTLATSLQGPEESLLRKERIETLRKVLATLSPGELFLFYRKYYYLQTIPQIAAETGLTERAVEGRLYRLKKKLRLQLGGEDFE